MQMTTTVKLLTYNIHYGYGRDRRYDLGRILQVLQEESPDVAALQEVDNGVVRSRRQDQSKFLAEHLGMDSVHCVTRRVDGGDFGITVLSRHRIVRNQNHDITHWTSREPRACVRVDVAICGTNLHVFNCHLGLGTRERHYQRRRMLSEAMLLSEDLHHPVVLMGDFNDRPVPVVHDELRAHFQDAFVATGKRHGPTFWWGPVHLRLDHIYTSPGIRVLDSYVRNDALTRVASDHRPLIAVVELNSGPRQDTALGRIGSKALASKKS